MAIASVLLGVVALLMMFGGIFLSWLPIVGSVLSFGAPVLSLVGIVLGGLAMSRAKQEGNPSGAALAGVIINVLAFLFGLLVAMTCGLCNACVSTAMIEGRNYDGGPNGFRFQIGNDGGLGGWPGIDEGPGMGVGPLPGDPGFVPGTPPPALPPPAMPAGGPPSGDVVSGAPPNGAAPVHDGPPEPGTGDATGPPPTESRRHRGPPAVGTGDATGPAP